jgi:hypothetical protein
MTDLPGGPSDKAGNNYEALWGVVCFLKICAGKAKAIRIEPPRVDTAEFYLDVENTRQYWQTKRQHLHSSWTLRALADEKVLEFFLRELRAGNSCVFASITDAEELRTLSTAAKNAANYSEFIDKFLSKDRVKSFSTLCGFWKPIENEEAFELLKRIEVKSGTEATLQDEVLYPLASAFLNGSDKGVVRCLKDIYFTSLHKTLTAAEIYAELERAGFSRKAADSSTAKTAIEQITNSYLAGQQSRLIKGALIPRPEAVEAAQRLLVGEESKDLVILGVAGAGKSAFTFQLVEELQRLGANVLAFRLDELQPGATTLSLGSQLGLAQSPAIELAGCTPDQQAVFVLDQLDCLSVVSIPVFSTRSPH